MKLLIIVLMAMALHSTAQEKAHLSRDIGVAKPAVEKLMQNHDVDALVEVVEHSNLSELQLSAISAIGVPNYRIAAVMLRVLESLNVELLEGGSDQVNERTELKYALMNSVARALNLKAPQDASIAQIAAFVADAGKLIKEADPSKEHPGEGEEPTISPNPPPSVQFPAPKKAPESNPALTPSEGPSSSTPWSIIVVLIVAASGLLWLLLKRRS